MNTSLSPFDDPRVREAMRLVIDRQAMVNGVLLGQGDWQRFSRTGHDGYHEGLPQRTRVVARATELFSAADVSELDFAASEVAPGLLASGELLAEQLSEACVLLEIERYDDLENGDCWIDYLRPRLPYSFSRIERQGEGQSRHFVLYGPMLETGSFSAQCHNFWRRGNFCYMSGKLLDYHSLSKVGYGYRLAEVGHLLTGSSTAT